MSKQVKRAFSYIRFSDSKQAKGDSLRRQLEWGPALAARQGWVFDDRLKADEGVSAFRGKNAATGHLAAFLKAIKARSVAPGDVLLLESLDRLTREDIDPAWELFRSILKAGVEIFTREPERHYHPADLNNFGTRIEVQAYMLRAYNESATKSMRGRAFWEAQRAKLAGEKRPLHKVLPAWLRLSADRRQFEVIPEAAEAVRLIYRWAREGIGTDPITARLNAEGIPPIGNNIRRKVFKSTWSRSYVAKILQERTVLGEFQPHVMAEVPADPNDPDGPRLWKRVPHGEPVKGYFPQIIPEEEWNIVRQAVKSRGRDLGPKGVGVANLFTSLMRDAKDGETFHLTYAGSSRKNNTRMLVSYGSRTGKPGSVYCPFPYDAVEAAFLQTVRELTAADITGEGDGGLEVRIAALASKRDDLDQKITAVQRRVLEEKGIDPLLSLLETLGKEKKATEAELERLKAEAASRQAKVIEDALNDVKSVSALLAKAGRKDRQALRLKVRARVKQLVSAIWVLTFEVTPKVRAAELQIVFHSGKVKGVLLVWSRRGQSRGVIAGVGALLAEAGDAGSLAGKLLSEYRTCPDTREFFDTAHSRLGPALLRAVDAEAAAIMAVAMASPEALAAASRAMDEAQARGERPSNVRRAGVSAGKKVAKQIVRRMRSLGTVGDRADEEEVTPTVAQ